MNRSPFFIIIVIFTLILILPSSSNAAAPNDNTAPPYIGAYKGSVNSSSNPYGAKNNAAYAAWLNRTIIWGVDSQPGDWSNLEGESWQLAPWSEWRKALPGRKFILCVPIVPGPWDGSGPKQGIDSGAPVSLEDGANGTYNEHYRKLAENLVKYGLGDSILRLGVEFNGGWFAWRVQSNSKAEAFADYWKQIVTTMRAVPGAENLKFCWNVGAPCYCAFDPGKAWPGDAYVDYVGLDTYDDCYQKDTYPWPKDASPEEIQRRREKAWHDSTLTAQFGLQYWSKFATNHHKPICFPEWGVDNKPDHHGGGDDPYFIEQMHKFINDPANNVYFHCYFDYQAGDGHHQLAPKADGTVITEFPNSAAKFKELFSLPSTSPLPASAENAKH